MIHCVCARTAIKNIYIVTGRLTNTLPLDILIFKFKENLYCEYPLGPQKMF